MRYDRMTTRKKRGQEGMVLFIVLMLILMFTGLGIMAMRHTRQELRSTGAYYDNHQASAMAEGALAMVATDIKQSSDFYRMAFTNPDYQQLTASGDTEFVIPLNEESGRRNQADHPVLFETSTGGYCEKFDGTVRGCVHQLSYPLTGNEDLDNMYSIWARTLVRHSAPRIGPCPPGFSCDDEQNYGWYIFDVSSEAIYGTHSGADKGLEETLETNDVNYSPGRARARAVMTVGPIGVFGQ